MKRSDRLELRRSEIRTRLGELAEAESPTEEQVAEIATLETEYRTSESQLRAAIVAEEAEEAETREEHGDTDPETRERIELRQRANLGTYLRAAIRGGVLQGAEAELMEAAGINDSEGGIPIELWDVPEERTEERVVTGAPGTVGVNLDLIRPHVFAPSVLPRLGVEMPRVGTGSYASATISTATTAGAVAKSGAAPETAAGFTVETATPKRVAASLRLTFEDIAAVGQANFEAALRQNLSMALSSELDDQGLNGAGASNDLVGLFHRLTNPSAPGATVADFDDFVAAFAGGVDGLWAMRMADVAVVCGVDTYRVAAAAYRDGTGNNPNALGDVSFADYAMSKFGGFWTNSRMPSPSSNVQQAILHRRGRMGMRTAVCPHWGRIGIDDIYSGSTKGERIFSLHVILGDVIVVQPGAYAQVSFRTST